MKNYDDYSTQQQRSLLTFAAALTVAGITGMGPAPLRAQSLPEMPPSVSETPAKSTPGPRSQPQPQALDPTSQPTVTEVVRLGDDRYAQADYQGAVEAYSQALQAYQLNAYALYNRANAYRQLEAYEAAIADYTASLKLAPDNWFAYLYRGMALGESQQPEAAIADFSVVIEQNPKHALAFQLRGESYLAQGNPTAAIQDLEKAASLYQDEEKFRKYSQVQQQLKKARSAKSKQ